MWRSLHRSRRRLSLPARPPAWPSAPSELGKNWPLPTARNAKPARRRSVRLSDGDGRPARRRLRWRRGALPLSSLPNEGTAPRDTVLASHRSLRATEKEIPVSREDGLGSPMGDLVTAEGQGPARGPEAEPTTAEPARHLAPRGSAQRGGRLSPAPAPPSRHRTSRERRGPRARRTPSPSGSQCFTCNTND